MIMKRNVIEERRSIRRYKSKSVSRKEIEQLVEVAALAPSAKNRQPWKYIVYMDREKDRLLNGVINAPGQLIGAVAVGYADDAPQKRTRKTLEEILEYR